MFQATVALAYLRARLPRRVNAILKTARAFVFVPGVLSRWIDAYKRRKAIARRIDLQNHAVDNVIKTRTPAGKRFKHHMRDKFAQRYHDQIDAEFKRLTAEDPLLRKYEQTPAEQTPTASLGVQ